MLNRASYFLAIVTIVIFFQNCGKSDSQLSPSSGGEPYGGNNSRAFADLSSTCPDGSYSHQISQNLATKALKYVVKDCVPDTSPVVVPPENWAQDNLEFIYEGRTFRIPQ